MNILCKYEKKIKVRILFICIFRKYMFCVQLYNLYFEALKGLLLKDAP